MSSDHSCAVCGVTGKLLRCSRCKSKLYCSREHQKRDWKEHKAHCTDSVPIPEERSSDSEIINSFAEHLSEQLVMPIKGADITLGWAPQHDLTPGIDDICRNVIRDLNEFGVCVVDNFIGEKRCSKILDEVFYMYTTGMFQLGQLVSTKGDADITTIRGDQIAWIDGKESFCTNIQHLISQVDVVVKRANKMANNGKLGMYNINGRTKAMVACYPGLGSHYVKHVDNPNRDGRCITAIYYLNLNWNVKKSGGLLRIFPEGSLEDRVADIEPLFDRLLFFWSDRRNPHEVQPAFDTRYAITLWYFDAGERAEACRRYEQERG